MNYPNRVIKAGDPDKAVVEAVQKQLIAKGCGPLEVDGDFGPDTTRAVKLFQSRFSDGAGNPLLADGKVGSHTWAALFGVGQVPSNTIASSPLAGKALEKAVSQVGVMEKPPGSNDGKEVNEYQDIAASPRKKAWCMAFMYWCYQKAANDLGVANPLVRTGGVLDQWNRYKGKKITARQAVDNPGLVKPGQLFIIDHGGGLGHTGMVEKVVGGLLTTIEGNSNDGGSREGIGVFRRTSRKINSINKGFIDV